MTEEDWLLFRLVSTPAALSEFLRMDQIDPDTGEPFRLWNKQVREMNREEKRKKRIQGRNLGKSITCADEFISHVLRYQGTEQGVALVGSRNQPTLQFIFDNMLVNPFQRNPFLKFFLVPGDKGINKKDFEIRLLDGSVIKGRIQGKDGAGFNTVHPNIASWFDEVQLLEDSAVSELYGMISGSTPLLVSGVPNGVRTSWAYKIDTDPARGFAGGKMTRLDDPRMTPEFLQELKDSYGGENSSGYLQKVMGEWGADARMTFDLERITRDLPAREPGAGTKAPAWYRSLDFAARDYTAEFMAMRFNFKASKLPAGVERVYIAADYGQTGSPTTAYVFFYDEKEQCWRQFMRFLLRAFQAPEQAEVFHYVATELEKQCGHRPWIGIDTTGQGGAALAAILQALGWREQIVWANFAENVEHGERLETDEEVNKRLEKDPFASPARQMVPIKTRLKQVAIPRLQMEFYAGSLRAVEEDALWKQLGATTDHESATGRDRIYVTDWTHDDQPQYDHDLQAFEVFAAMLHQLDFAPGIKGHQDMWIEEVPIGWGLTDPRWAEESYL